MGSQFVNGLGVAGHFFFKSAMGPVKCMMCHGGLPVSASMHPSTPRPVHTHRELRTIFLQLSIGNRRWIPGYTLLVQPLPCLISSTAPMF